MPAAGCSELFVCVPWCWTSGWGPLVTAAVPHQWWVTVSGTQTHGPRWASSVYMLLAALAPGHCGSPACV